MSVCITSGNEDHIREQYFFRIWRDGVLSILSSYKSQKDAIAIDKKIDDVLFPDTQTLVDDFTMAVEHKIMVKKEGWHKRYPSFRLTVSILMSQGFTLSSSSKGQFLVFMGR